MSQMDKLRRELAGIDEKREGMRQRLADAVEERRGLSRALIDGDKAAHKRDAALAAEIATANRTIEAVRGFRDGVTTLNNINGLERQRRLSARIDTKDISSAVANRSRCFDRSETATARESRCTIGPYMT
jgi:hypothetical protein